MDGQIKRNTFLQKDDLRVPSFQM